MGMDRTPFMNSGSKAVILIEVHAIGTQLLQQFDKELEALLAKNEYSLPDPNHPNDASRTRRPRRLVTLVTGVPPLPPAAPAQPAGGPAVAPPPGN